MQGPFGACPSCGGAVSATARFCGSCGRPIAPPPVAAPARRSSGWKLIAITAVAAVAIVAIGVGAGLVLRPNAGGTGGTGASPGSSPGPTATGGDQAIPSFALATPPIVNGHADESALTAPILQEGDVPAPQDPTTPITGHLTLGPAASPASQVIGPAGGTIEASGLRLEFPPGALAAATPVSLTQAAISAADFGGLVTPLTPLYTVDDGDAALSEAVTVTLGATVPDGAVALAFYYDDATGTLSPLSPLGENATSISAGATHFSSFFGGLVDIAKLDPIVDSGFRPGVDDWQFTNRGSYVSPRGQCLGQSMSAAWYYVNQRRAAHASSLYGLFDNNGAPTRTPTLDQDDSQGWRLASTFQVEKGSLPWLGSIYEAEGAIAKADDAYTYAAFKVAIALSGEPQVIGMRHQAGEGGHAMIVYRVTPQWLVIADPNYPAQYRAIRYDAATGFGSYLSGANAAEIATKGPTSYTRFAFLPWRGDSAIEAAYAADWADFADNKAGNKVFPKYTLEALAGTDAAGIEIWVPLVDGYTSQEKQLKIRLRDPANADDVATEVYDGTSTTKLGALNAEQTINLKDGDTPLGIAVYFSKPEWSNWGYVDFVRVTIKRANVAVMIEPPTDLCPQVGTEYRFEATATGVPATIKRVQFTWDFGNGLEPGQTFDAPFASPLVAEATQAFPAEDSVKVAVILNDVGGATSVELARAEIGFVTYREGSMNWTLCNHDPTQP